VLSLFGFVYLPRVEASLKILNTLLDIEKNRIRQNAIS